MSDPMVANSATLGGEGVGSWP